MYPFLIHVLRLSSETCILPYLVQVNLTGDAGSPLWWPPLAPQGLMKVSGNAEKTFKVVVGLCEISMRVGCVVPISVCLYMYQSVHTMWTMSNLQGVDSLPALLQWGWWEFQCCRYLRWPWPGTIGQRRSTQRDLTYCTLPRRENINDDDDVKYMWICENIILSYVILSCISYWLHIRFCPHHFFLHYSIYY